jgi:uncharacterized protein
VHPVAVIVAAAVTSAAAAGAFFQRLSGLGFSLIAAPSLALIAGPRDGVTLANLLAIMVALSVFAPSARQVDAAAAAVLVPAGLAGVVPGMIVFRLVPSSVLQVAVGTLTGLGLLAVMAARRVRLTSGLATTTAAGLASGFTTAVAGAGGPALTVYAVATGWPQPQFAATGQLSYAAQAAAALAIKGLPPFPAGMLIAAMVAALCGLAAGHLAARRVAAAQARRVAIGLAALATLLTVIKGLLAGG